MFSSPSRTPQGLIISRRYRILRKLGSGAIGAVYLARDEAAERPVALKVIKKDRLGEEGVAQLQEEFRAIASLHHPQIAAAYDFGYTEDGDIPYYTREYIEGRPLEPGPPPVAPRSSPRDFLRPFFDLLEALEYLHSHDILHLDIHPENLIVAKDARRGGVLIDFGLPRPLKGSSAAAPLEVRWTMPPELLGAGEAGPPADLYSAGRLLLYRLTGRIEGEASLPQEIPGWGPRLTLELERIIRKALQEDPRRRFQSARAFREALSKAAGGTPSASRAAEPGDSTAGRERELQRIDGVLRQAKEGRPALLWLRAGPSLGKTRLLEEARLRAQLLGLEAVSVRFLPQPGAHAPLLQALAPLTGRRPRPPGWLGPLSAEHGGSSAERSQRAARAYFVAEGPPLILLLDDLERADRASRMLAEALIAESVRRLGQGRVGRGLGLLIASVSRPEGDWVKSAPRQAFLALKPLSARESISLLAALIRPLSLPAPLARKLAEEVQGHPLRLRQAAKAIRERWGRAGSIPAAAQEALLAAVKAAVRPAQPLVGHPVDLEILRTLAILDRPASLEEIVLAVDLPAAEAKRSLRRLLRQEGLMVLKRGRERLFHFSHPDAARELKCGVPLQKVRILHERLADRLLRAGSPEPWHRENLARHLLRCGRKAAGREAALRTAALLRRKGLLQNAAGLLGEALRLEESPRWQRRYAEELSAIHELLGDHQDGISLLEPWVRTPPPSMDREERVRLLRRLGAHCHRAGMAGRALDIFREAIALADPDRDAEELVFIHSELAELHTYQGNYAEAEKACRRGLELMARMGRGARFERGRLEMTLRASLGHLELRRMNLEKARDELLAALKLSRAYGTTAVQALVLDNLGIVHNQQNRFQQAERCFHRAERLLIAAGERRELIQIACNLALIAAKTGDGATAREQVERAAQLTLQHPGKRLEFYVELIRGMVAHLTGEMEAAIEALQTALPLGRELGDRQFVRFGIVYLAEARLACGQYRESRKLLGAAAEQAGRDGPPVLRRMASSRLYFLESLLGRKKAALAARQAFESAPPTGIEYLEAWSDLFIGAARLIEGGEALEPLRSALRAFRRMGVPAGSRFAQAGLLCRALQEGDGLQIRAGLKDLESQEPAAHKILAILEPLARAEACFALGELDRSREAVEEAAGALIGCSCLELDWRLEFLRSLQAERQGDRDGARRCLHRALHTRDGLARALPAPQRELFLSHPRFAALDGLASRLKKSPALLARSGSPAARGTLPELIGGSPALQPVVKMIDKLHDQDIPVVITGETGTGKELVARALHRTGPRRDGPFLALDCASLPPDLFEAELFGYEAGAFTGAEESRTGLLEHLSGGTLLLDEVARLVPSSQAKLLRVLDSQTVRPLGSHKARPVNVRFLACSSASLQEAVAAQTLRADFYFRLRGVEIQLPPLRARKQDIPALVEHFIGLHSKRLERPEIRLTPAALEFLKGYDWPGNVRELEMLILRLLVTASGGAALGVEAVKPLLPSPQPAPLFDEDRLAGKDLKELRRELERAYLLRLFKDTGGDLEKMMARLQVKRANLYHWLQRVGLSIKELRKRPGD
ncbi:MAG: sigma 54-interacting transcriptional regulator [Planctomycetes bacterium]|nr:sigma 54-interacting transcriptional regulator [Planctomycetota bacterium]